MNVAYHAVRAPTVGSPWTGLCRVGGAAALIAAILFRRNLGTEFLLLRSFGIFRSGPTLAPADAVGWFSLLQERPFLGLTLLNLFDLVNYALVGLIVVGLYAALREINRSLMTIATASALVGIAVYFASNQAFAMLTLSDRYTAATTEAARSTFLAAGEALLAINNPGAIYSGTGTYLSLLLVTIAGLIASIVMLGSRAFGRAIAYVGILAHAFELGYFVALIFAPIPALLAAPPSISAVFLLAWYILLGLRLLRLGANELEGAA